MVDHTNGSIRISKPRKARDDPDHTFKRLMSGTKEVRQSAGYRPFGQVTLESYLSAALELIGMPEPHSVIVYSRKGCHLCEVVKESLSKLSRRGMFTWHEVDVDADPDLRRQYNDEVPVVFINGRKAFKYHMDEQEFLRKLSN